MANKPEPRPTDAPHAPEEAKSSGETRWEMAFLPLANPPRPITVRSGASGRPLKLGRLAKEQG